MAKYIDAEKLIAEIDKRLMSVNLEELGNNGSHRVWAYNDVKDIVSSLKQEQPEADLERIENDAELIANTIMIGVQSSRYHTCVYNTGTNDFNHSHLVQAAKKGIELGLKVRKVE